MEPKRINRDLSILFLLLLFVFIFILCSLACLVVHLPFNVVSDSPGLTGLSGNDSLRTCLTSSDRPGSLWLGSSFSGLFLLIDWRLSISNTSALNSCKGVWEIFHVCWLNKASKSTFAFSKLSFLCKVYLTLSLEEDRTTTSVATLYESLSFFIPLLSFSEPRLDDKESLLSANDFKCDDSELDFSLSQDVEFICQASLGLIWVNSSWMEGDKSEKQGGTVISSNETLASKKRSNCDSDNEQWSCLRSGVTCGSACSSSNS